VHLQPVVPVLIPVHPRSWPLACLWPFTSSTDRLAEMSCIFNTVAAFGQTEKWEWRRSWAGMAANGLSELGVVVGWGHGGGAGSTV
jgi:hypothetical protein